MKRAGTGPTAPTPKDTKSDSTWGKYKGFKLKDTKT